MAQATDSGGSATHWSTRVPPDVDDRLTEFSEDRGLNKSSALRQAAKRGVEEIERQGDWTIPSDLVDDLEELRDAENLSEEQALRVVITEGMATQQPRRQWARDLKQLADHMVPLGLIVFIAGAFWPSGGLLPALTLGLTFATVSAVSYLVAYYVRVNY